MPVGEHGLNQIINVLIWDAWKQKMPKSRLAIRRLTPLHCVPFLHDHFSFPFDLQ